MRNHAGIFLTVTDFEEWASVTSWKRRDQQVLQPAVAVGNVIEVGGNAHARRKFVAAEKTDLTRAAAALGFYRELYTIEKAIKEEIARTAPEDKVEESERAAIRLRIRQERAVPVLERFREWLEAQKPDLLAKSPFGIALGYVQNNGEALTRYASSGYLAIDNNVAGQHMGPISDPAAISIV